MIPLAGSPATSFVWGMKRSGIHLIANWLYANHGATVQGELATDGLHPQLCDGFRDEAAGVAFYNNCGRFHSRRFELGDISGADFALAAGRHAATIFGIEDCALRFASKTARIEGSVNVLVLRDPLNNLASRLEAARTMPEAFPVNEAYIDLFAEYCAEFLGRSNNLAPKVLVNYNRFVHDRPYRDSLAEGLGLPNHDAVSEVSEYGGGSSFGAGDLSPAAVTTRFLQHPIPRPLLDLLLERTVVRETCTTVFGYDLARLADGG
jgi:hypothetical protein